MGVTKSESLDTMIVSSQSLSQQSKSSQVAKLTSDRFSSVLVTLTIAGLSGVGFPVSGIITSCTLNCP